MSTTNLFRKNCKFKNSKASNARNTEQVETYARLWKITHEDGERERERFGTMKNHYINALDDLQFDDLIDANVQDNDTITDERDNRV